jgi:hypothetical protein
MLYFFLVVFTFTTGTVDEITETRIVVIKQAPDDDYKEEALLDIAMEKAKAWFPNMYPESELISTVIKPAIE